MNAAPDDTSTTQDADHGLLSDFDDWLEHELPRIRLGITWMQRDDAPNGTAHADWLAGDGVRLRYAIVAARAHQVPNLAGRLQALSLQHASHGFIVLASPDWIKDEDKTRLPRFTMIWDAHYWWQNRWEWIRASTGYLTTEHLRGQVAQFLLECLASLPSGGQNGADRRYEGLVMAMLRFVFGHQLLRPLEQVTTQDRAQRRDGLLDNHATDGPWAWLVQHHFHAPTITVDAKNLSHPLDGPTIDDVARYLGARRPGSVGILACRHRPKPDETPARHLTTLAREGILLLPFDDSDFRTMIEACAAGNTEAVNDVVYGIIQRLRAPL